jgi:hypothetical protein
MFPLSFHRCLLLVLLALAAVCPSVQGEAPEIVPPFRDPALPEPPRQKQAWQAPELGLPADFISAISLLFEEGFADPRGCPYHAIKVAVSTRYSDISRVVTTHGWLLPEKEGNRHRCAICWNGLVYPTVSIGDKVELKTDVEALLSAHPKEVPEMQRLWGECNEALSLASCRSGDLSVALLLRLGEDKLALRLWGAHYSLLQQPGQAGPRSHRYVGLASSWAQIQLQRAASAHQRGDDALALLDLRRLSAFAEAATREARGRGFLPPEQSLFDSSLDQLPALLADQERRAKQGAREPLVCMGPGRHPEPSRRIAGLIARLEEVDTVVTSHVETFDPERSPILKALISEGEAAVEPLLDCYEKDQRLTRSTQFSDILSPIGQIQPVHEAALITVLRLLDELAFDRHLDRVLPRHHNKQDERKRVAEALRQSFRAAKRLSVADRWFRVLADDRAKPELWQSAALILCRQKYVREKQTNEEWSAWAAHREGAARTPQPLRGEPLRSRTDPSVTDLLLKRFKQCEEQYKEWLAWPLAEWASSSDVFALRELTRHYWETGNGTLYGSFIEARIRAGDRDALDEYVAQIAKARPAMLQDDTWGHLFQPMRLHHGHPGMAAASEQLFNNPNSPWLPLREDKDHPAYYPGGLVSSALLRLPGFRKEVLRRLSDTAPAGEVTLKKNGEVSMSGPGGDSMYSSGTVDLLAPPAGTRQTFRVCDYYAKQVSGRDGAPRCELYWPEAQRNDAVAVCRQFLLQYGDWIDERGTTMPRLDKPATAEQLRNGLAIFSLSGQGETRVVKGLTLPLRARWLELKSDLFQHTRYDPQTGKKHSETSWLRDGQVHQAEEVFKDGRWQRSYGFIGAHRISQVPAGEIEFPPEEERWSDYRRWVRIAPGFDARLKPQARPAELFKGYPPLLSADTALVFGLGLRNASGLDQLAPSLQECVRLQLLYSPALISRQGALIPVAARPADWVEVARKPEGKLPQEEQRTLAPAEEIQAARLDLRTAFELSKPGFYRLRLITLAKEPTKDVLPGEAYFLLGEPAGDRPKHER